MTGSGPVRRGLAVPNFAEDPAWLVRLGIDAERSGFDGYFLWDHLTHSDTGHGLPAVDPWQVLALVAAGTSRIRLGPLITPVPRRRPWKLAKEVTALDLLSGGRVILGVSTQGFDIAVWGTLDDGTLAGVLPGYAALWVTWWIESVEIDEPGWQEAIAARVRAGR